MVGAPVSQLAHIATDLLPSPTGDSLTSDQWASFLAICEVFFPSMPSLLASNGPKYATAKAEIKRYAATGVSEETIDEYLQSSFDRVKFKEALRRRMMIHLPKSQVLALASGLALLNSRLGSLIMTGSMTPIQNQDIETRTRIVCGWADSYLQPLRTIFASLESLSKITWIQGSQPLVDITGFPVVPEKGDRQEGYKFDFIGFETAAEGTTVELKYDIVIVGSGCGAGVAASHLGRAARKLPEHKRPKILVLEKGFYFPASHFPMNAAAAGDNLMEGGGVVPSNDGSIAVLAGSTWGGGGTVNWSASLQPQSFVREEWVEKDGLQFFSTAEFQDCLDTVCEQMGVCKMTDEAAKSQIPQSYGNHKLLEGARLLGLTAEVVPQNSANKAHQCSHCSEGCASATKQGPANYWLPDAAENGVELIEGCYVEEILWDNTTTPSGKRRVAGLKAEWTSRDRSTKRRLFIQTKRVIVSASTLQSPALLIRSGVTNKHLGANLHLHPTMCTGITWSERADPWEGPILTAAVTSHENFDHEGHGPKVELIAGTIGWMLPWLPWNPDPTLKSQSSSTSSNSTSDDSLFASSLDYKVQAAKFGYTTGYIAIQRDRDTGRIYLDAKDPSRRNIRMSYNASPRDRAGLLEGVIVAARTAYATGAVEIRPYASKIPAFVRSRTASQATNDEAFRNWIKDTRAIWTANPENCKLGSAHQMGTCRMGANRDSGVVDSTGKLWDHEGVYVADASVFPSASGVNPMVTTMGISEWISRGIARELVAEAAA